MSTAPIARTHPRASGDVRRPGSPPAAPRPVVVTRAELAECTCPDDCERDHERD